MNRRLAIVTTVGLAGYSARTFDGDRCRVNQSFGPGPEGFVAACEKLAKKLGWTGHWIGAQSASGTYTFVCVEHSAVRTKVEA